MRRALQRLVPQSILAQQLPLLPIRFGGTYVCADCRRFVFQALGPRRRRRKEKEKGVEGRGGGYVFVRGMKGKEGADKPEGGSGSESQEEIEKGIKFSAIEEAFFLQDWEELNPPLSPNEWILVQEHLSSFDQLLDEANVGPKQSKGKKLVDDRSLTFHVALWRVLLLFKKRVHVDEGVKEIWKGMRLRNFEIPVEGRDADRMWQIFLTAGLRDEAFMKKVWKYIEKLYTRSNGEKRWDRIYDTIINYYFITDFRKVRIWQRLLMPRHPPKSSTEFFEKLIKKHPTRQWFIREIHAMMSKPAGVYSTVIPLLCRMGMQIEAMKWHRHCFIFEDLPETSSISDPLFAWVARYGTIHDLWQFLDTFTKAGMRLEESSVVEIVDGRPLTVEVLETLFHGKYKNIEHGVLGDNFWACIFLQYDLGVDDMTKFFAGFEGEMKFGERTIAAFMKRGGWDREKALGLLTQFGIVVEDESFGGENGPEGSYLNYDAEDLASIKGSYDHLAALLEKYLLAENWEVFDQTISSIPETPFGPKLENLVLRSQLQRNRIREALSTIEYMRSSKTEVLPSSIHTLISAILRPRRSGNPPAPSKGYIEDDLTLVIGILISFLRTGFSRVPPTLWWEIFKRLGMTNRLSDLENLAVGLVEWYHPSHATSTRRRFAPSKFSRKLGQKLGQKLLGEDEGEAPVEIPTISPENPLRKLFPSQFIRAIVEWGFLDFRAYDPKTTSPLIPPPTLLQKSDPKYKDIPTYTVDFTWGIRLALKLQKRGVHVDTCTITSALRTRLNVLFGQGMSECPKNQLAMRLFSAQDLTLEEMVEILETAWEGRLWRRVGWWTRWGKKKELESMTEAQRVWQGKREKAMRRQVLGAGWTKKQVKGWMDEWKNREGGNVN